MSVMIAEMTMKIEGRFLHFFLGAAFKWDFWYQSDQRGGRVLVITG